MANNSYERNNRINEALAIRGMKQVDLCELTGISKGALNNWVKQRWQPRQTALFKMAKVLDVSEMWLAGYDVPMDRVHITDYDYSINVNGESILLELNNDTVDKNTINRLLKYLSALKPDQLKTIENIAIQFNELNNKD